MQDLFGASMEALRKLEDDLFWQRQSLLLKVGWTYSTTTAKAERSKATYVKSYEGAVYVAFNQFDAIEIEKRLRCPKPVIKF